MDRYQGLEIFAKSDLDNSLKNGDRLTLISGDASFRKYYRLGDKIFVDAPVETEKNKEFVTYSNILSTYGVKVPKVFDYDFANGYLKIEDFGNVQFAEKATGENQEHYYKKAIFEMVKLSDVKENIFEQYDKNFIEREVKIFLDWYLDKHLKNRLTEEQEDIWNSTIQILVNNDINQTQIAMHRDFHCRNIMIVGNELGLLDFQDMVRGPITYDLVSLLKDCYVTLEYDLRQNLLEYGYELYKSKNLLANISLEKFTKYFDLTGMQRHLKAIGIFCRLKYRDNKDQYLQYLPRTFNYINEVCEKYSELDSFKKLLNEVLL